MANLLVEPVGLVAGGDVANFWYIYSFKCDQGI